MSTMSNNVSSTASNALRSALQGFHDVSTSLWDRFPKPKTRRGKTAWIVFAIVLAYVFPLLNLPVVTTTSSGCTSISCRRRWWPAIASRSSRIPVAGV